MNPKGNRSAVPVFLVCEVVVCVQKCGQSNNVDVCFFAVTRAGAVTDLVPRGDPMWAFHSFHLNIGT